MLVKLLAEKIVVDSLNTIAEAELSKLQGNVEGFYEKALEIARATGEKLVNLRIQ
jgi:hypothetical protein